ncbi:MAG: hypothetical protein FWG05_04075 [Kiritimatiellaeota bacterium]|nr:hypothetical protein [Kiritimatiellota bacterium]
MSQELQALLDKIQSEGVDKANEKAKAITDAAERDAAARIAAAEKKAAEIVAKAEAEAAVLRERAEQAVRQAARDIVLETESKIRQTFERLMLRDTESALSGDALKPFLETVVRAAANESSGAVEALVPPAQVAEMTKFAASRLAGEVKGGLKISASNDIKAGIRIMVNDGRIEHDFTAAALTEAMTKLMNPMLAEMIFNN